MDSELLLRWMSEVGSGDIRDLRDRIAWWARSRNLPATNYRTGRWLRDLSALAHAEIDWTSGRWAVTPPAAALLPGTGGTAVLTGSRRTGFHEQLKDLELAVHVADPPPTADRAIPLPPPIHVQADSMKDLERQLAAAHITYAGEAALNIARVLNPIDLGPLAGPPSWESPVEHLRQSGDDMRFDSGLPSRDGLCRITLHGRPHYMYRRGNDWYHTDQATGILVDLAARGENVMRWKHNREADGRSYGTVFLDQRSPLPPLQARALVLCSGLPATVSERAKTVIYRNVPKEVAELVAQSVLQTQVVIA